MYLKLLNSNFRKAVKDYQIYIITLVISSALFFAFVSLSSPYNTIIADGSRYSDELFRETINLTVGLVSLIFFVLVNYVNNHMLKRRSKEFSLYMLLGMEQRKIAFSYFIETFEIGIAAIFIGTILGILLSGGLTSIVLVSTGGKMDYKVGFYPDTFLKTFLFFIFVFVFTGMFNTRKLAKTKLLELLNAEKVSEGQSQRKNIYMIGTVISILSFAIAAVMLKKYLSVERDYMSNVPAAINNRYQTVIGATLVCGIFSGCYAASYIIRIIRDKSTKYKYKKLNVVFINNLYARSTSNAKVIASATIAIAVSILGFVIAPVLADISEEFLDYRMPYDLMINNSYRYIDLQEDIPYIDYSFVRDILAEYGIEESEVCQQESYFVWGKNFKNANMRDSKWDMPRLAISLSDYNQMRQMANLPTIDLNDNEFALQVSNEIDKVNMEAQIKSAESEIILDDKRKLVLSAKPVYNDAVGTFLYNFGNSSSFIFADSVCENLKIANTCYYANTSKAIPINDCTEIEKQIKKQFRANYPELYDKYETKYKTDKDYQDFINPIRFMTQEINSVKINSVCIRLLGVYIGVIFFVICLSVLALQQLSDAENSKKQYWVMYKLGIEEKEIYSLIKKQISIFFSIPCVLAMIGAGIGVYVFLLRFGHKVEAYIGTEDFILNIFLAVIMLLIIFISYFWGTVKAYHHSIETVFKNNFRKQI